jgi:hypothetical protein
MAVPQAGQPAIEHPVRRAGKDDPAALDAVLEPVVRRVLGHP